jgi:DNA mismatch endonuclease (patch repair protein)
MLPRALLQYLQPEVRFRLPDAFSKVKRSNIMSRVRGQDTKPELLVRRILHGLGYRFRLHRRDLPGSPDIVLPRYRKVVFVHGCFWHGHEDCPRAVRPMSNVEFWNRKLDGNKRRDLETQHQLTGQGWGVLVVWQCQTKNADSLRRRLQTFLREEGGNIGEDATERKI